MPHYRRLLPSVAITAVIVAACSRAGSHSSVSVDDAYRDGVVKALSHCASSSNLPTPIVASFVSELGEERDALGQLKAPDDLRGEHAELLARLADARDVLRPFSDIGTV